jgi:excisionase family DNA binding protein
MKKTEIRPDERRAWRVNDFCGAHGVSRSTVYKLMKSGALRTVLVGGRRLIPDDAAAELMNGGAK